MRWHSAIGTLNGMSDKPTDHLLFGPQEPLDLLYHYTSAATFTDYIAPNMNLMLSAFDRMNDPRECDRWEFDWLTPPGDDVMQARDRLNDDIRAQARLACFCRDEDIPERKPTFFEIAYTRGFSRPRMWAQYAANHSGVCVIFDRHRLLANFEAHMTKHKLTLLFGVVDYANRKPVGGLGRMDAFTVIDGEYRTLGPDRYAMHHAVKHHRELFFSKHLDWRDENEYRIMLYGKSQGDVLASISGALKHVVLGSKCAGETRENVISACCGLHVDASYMTWKNGYPQPMPLVASGRRLFR